MDLAKRHTVRELVAVFQQAEHDVRAAFASITEAERKLNAAFTLGESRSIYVEAGRGYGHDYTDADDAIDRMARQAWGCIVERLELRRMMSIARYDELEKRLKNEKLPPITEESVAAFVRQYGSQIPEMVGEAIKEVFEWLRPRGSQYKTNSELEIGSKVILSHIIERAPLRPGYRIRYYYQQHLTALENVFTALDGQGMISKTHYSALQNAIEASADGVVETSYFRVRCFKNGNMHLELKRIDLLKRFNQMAGGMRLKPNVAA